MSHAHGAGHGGPARARVGESEGRSPSEINGLTSRLRSIVRPSNGPARELTYEPDTGRYEATIDIDRVADILGGHVVSNAFGRALVIDRRYDPIAITARFGSETANSRARTACGCSIRTWRAERPRRWRGWR